MSKLIEPTAGPTKRILGIDIVFTVGASPDAIKTVGAVPKVKPVAEKVKVYV